MGNETSWEYYSDFNDAATTGNFYLYRNPHDLGPDGLRYRRYVTTPQPPESTEMQITMTHPVAFGITAYFVGNFEGRPNLYFCLSRNTKFNTISLYETYFHHASKWFFLDNTKSSKPKTETDITFIFLTGHLEQEKVRLLDSEDYYLESFDREDLSIKSQVKEYVNGYLTWLEEKRQHLIDMYPDLINLSDNKKFASSQKTNHQSILPYKELDNSRFIKATEFFLKSITIWIHTQFFPDSEFLKKYGRFYPFEEGTVLSFFLRIDTDILDFVLFERRIMDMLLFGASKENLSSILNEAYSFANAISKLSDDKISLTATDGFFMEFNHVDLSWHILNTKPINSDFHHYYNFDFVRYSIGIKNILENKLGLKENKNELMNGQMNQHLYTVNIKSETKSYLIKTEAFLAFMIKYFELQLNPDTDFRVAYSLGAYQTYNTEFEYVYSSLDDFLDLETFKSNVISIISDSKSPKAAKSILKPLFKSINAITEVYSQRMQYTTWDKKLTLHIEYKKGNITCDVGDPFYPDDFICKSNIEVAEDILFMRDYLKTALFPDKQIKEEKKENSKPIESIQSATPVINIKPKSAHVMEQVYDYLDFIQDIDGFLAFIVGKFSLYPDTPEQLEFLKNSPNPPEWRDPEFLVKSTTPALVPSTFITKTRQIRFGKVLTDAELFPMLAKIHTTVASIFDLCKHPPSDRSFSISLILSGKRNKVGPQIIEDDYDYEHYVYLSEVKLLEFCNDIYYFLQTEIFKEHVVETPNSETLKKSIQTKGLTPYINPDDEINQTNQDQNMEDPQQVLSEILKPLNIAIGQAIQCIDYVFIEYLIKNILSILDEEDFESPRIPYDVRDKELFYSAISQIKHLYFKKKPARLLNLISEAVGIKVTVARNYISKNDIMKKKK